MEFSTEKNGKSKVTEVIELPNGVCKKDLF